jgi:type IV pilus biogenesis protein CpaD/CtpE
MLSFGQAWLVALTLPLLAACSGIYGANVPGGLDARRVDLAQPVAQQQLLNHQVTYAAMEVIPSTAEQAKLADFLFARDVQPGAFIALTVEPAATPALTAGREQALRTLLQRWGYQSGIATSGGTRAGSGQSALVIVQQLVLLPPEGCAGASAAAVIAKPNEVAISRMGCATAHNLGVMVSDKRDLLAGDALAGVSDGERAAQLYDYYRHREHALERGEEEDPGGFSPAAGGGS